MTGTAAWVCRILVRDLHGFDRELGLFPVEAQLWETLPGVANPAGTLALHVSGNLLHFVGAVLGGTGYVRDRDLELRARGVPRADLSARIAEAVAVVETVLPGLTEPELARPYPLEIAGGTLPTGLFLVHLSVHLAHHLGQAGYLRRILTASSASAAPAALAELVERGAPGGG